MVKLLEEAWRHAKAIGTIDGAGALAAARVPEAGAGVVNGSGDEVAQQLIELLGAHRVWERFTPMA